MPVFGTSRSEKRQGKKWGKPGEAPDGSGLGFFHFQSEKRLKREWHSGYGAFVPIVWERVNPGEQGIPN
jgi:hypothetical protein